MTKSKQIGPGIEEMLDRKGIRLAINGDKRNSYLLLFLDDTGAVDEGYLCSPRTCHLVSLLDLVDKRFHNPVQAVQRFGR